MSNGNYSFLAKRRGCETGSMTWNYRIIHYTAGGYGLHEVFYDDKGEVEGWTDQAIDFGCDEDEGKEGVIKSLKLALKDAKRQPVMEEKDALKK